MVILQQKIKRIKKEKNNNSENKKKISWWRAIKEIRRQKKKQISEEIKRKQKVSEEDQDEKYKDELTTINVLEDNLYSNYNQKEQSNQLEPQSQTSEPCKEAHNEKYNNKNVTTEMFPEQKGQNGKQSDFVLIKKEVKKVTFILEEDKKPCPIN